MGKATIAGGGSDGSYQITLDYGAAARDARVTALTNRIAELSTKITEAQGAYDTAKNEVNAATVLASEAIEAYVLATKASDNPENWKDELAAYKARQTALFEAQSKAEPLRIKMGELKAQKAQAVKDKGYWEGVELEVTQAAWCVDLTEDATGEVGTIEVPGESAQILIVPGGAPPTGQDGILVAREVQRADQVFFNAAILPGWQKFKPTYRVGVIDALDLEADTADVTLVAATSSAQNLNVNRYTDLPGIPVEYMTCNAAAFEVGDRVVVAFAGGEWNTAKVIGFESNPKPCLPEYIDFDAVGVRGPWVGGGTRTILRGIIPVELYIVYVGPPLVKEVVGYYYSTVGEPYYKDILTATRTVGMELSNNFYMSEDIEGITVSVANRTIWSAVEGVGVNGGEMNCGNLNKYNINGSFVQISTGYEASNTAYVGSEIETISDGVFRNVPVDPQPGTVLVCDPDGLIGTGVIDSPDYSLPEWQNLIGPDIGSVESSTSPPATIDVSKGSRTVQYPFEGWHDNGGGYYTIRYRRPGSAP